MSRDTLETLVNRIRQLPALPVVVHRLIEVTADPNGQIDKVEQIVRADQALTAKVLQLVNSAFFALSSRVSTVAHAVVILGFDALRNTALTVCTYEYLRSCGRNAEFNKRALWEHAAAVGILAKRVAALARHRKADEAFVAGLLHDLGKIVLDEYFTPEFARALQASSATHRPLWRCERDELGFDHCVAGAEVARKWSFPPQLATAIEQHHAAAPSDVLTAAAMLADAMAKAWKIGLSGDALLHPISPMVWSFIPADEAALRRTVEAARDEIIQVQALFRSDDPAPSRPAPHEQPRPTGPAPDETEPERILFVTADEAPFIPLRIYLEQSGFDVTSARPEDVSPETDATGVVVWMPLEEETAQVKEGLLAAHPQLQAVPVVCAAPPLDPEAVVVRLRCATPNRTA